jgi:hypothetical protein
MHGLIGLDLAAVPEIGFAFAQTRRITGSKNLVRGLPSARTFRLHLPAQTRRGYINTQWIATIFTDEMSDGVHEISFVCKNLTHSFKDDILRLNLHD